MRASALFLLIALAAAGCRPVEPVPATQSSAVAPTLALSIATSGGARLFQVEVARTEAEQAKGLMYRTSLAPDAGMLFLFDPPRPASFWMKNTYIPLDMLFIRADGTIARVAANTTPHSLEPVGVGEDVAAVLEIAGGRAAQLGIAEGDTVSWPGGPR